MSAGSIVGPVAIQMSGMSILAAPFMLQAVLSFTTVAQGPVSAIDEPRQVVVRTAAEWQRLWRTHSPESPAPSVDFTQGIVVGVFLGARPTDGYSVQITSVREEDNRHVVEYRERRPDPGALVGQVLTAPFQLATLPQNVASVEFKRVDP